MSEILTASEEASVREELPTIELGELQLALVGGGIGDTIL